MPVYTSMEKTRPVPKRVTEEPDAEEQLAHMVEIFDEITTKEPLKTSWGATAFPVSPNKSGIIKVSTRLAKKLKTSLD